MWECSSSEGDGVGAFALAISILPPGPGPLYPCCLFYVETPVVQIIKVGLFKLGGEVFAFFLVDKTGRRPLFIASSTLVTFFLLFLGACFDPAAVSFCFVFFFVFFFHCALFFVCFVGMFV